MIIAVTTVSFVLFWIYFIKKYRYPERYPTQQWCHGVLLANSLIIIKKTRSQRGRKWLYHIVFPKLQNTVSTTFQHSISQIIKTTLGLNHVNHDTAETHAFYMPKGY